MFPQVVKPQISKQRYSNTRRLGTSFFWTHPISSTKVNERGWNAQGKTRRRATLVLPFKIRHHAFAAFADAVDCWESLDLTEALELRGLGAPEKEEEATRDP